MYYSFLKCRKKLPGWLIGQVVEQGNFLPRDFPLFCIFLPDGGKRKKNKTQNFQSREFMRNFIASSRRWYSILIRQVRGQRL